MLVIVGGTIWYFVHSEKNPKVVRRMSDEDPDKILRRAPVPGPCSVCGKPRCWNKDNPERHPPAPNKARSMKQEHVLRNPPRLPGRRKW